MYCICKIYIILTAVSVRLPWIRPRAWGVTTDLGACGLRSVVWKLCGHCECGRRERCRRRCPLSPCARVVLWLRHICDAAPGTMAEDGHSTASAELDGRGPTTVSPLQSDSHAAVSQSPSECGESAPLLAARTRSPQPGPVVGYGGVAPAVPTSPSARRTAQGGFERHIGGSFVRNRSEPELRSAFSPVGASDPGDAVGAARSPVRSAVSAPVTPGSSRRRRLSSAKLLRASDLDGDPAHAAHGDELAAPLLHVVGFDEDLEAGSDSGSVNPDQAGGNDAARNGHASGRGRRQRRRRGSGPECLAWCERCFACNPDAGSEEEQTSGSTEPAPRKSRYGTAWTVCGVVTLFLIAGGLIVGVYMYDHLVVPPPIAWTPQTPSSFQKPCPYANKTYFSHTGIHPQAPVVVLNGSWATTLCWARHEGYPMYELQVDNWWGNESMVFSTAFMYVLVCADVAVRATPSCGR